MMIGSSHVIGEEVTTCSDIIKPAEPCYRLQVRCEVVRSEVLVKIVGCPLTAAGQPRAAFSRGAHRQTVTTTSSNL